ncbi:MAG TPA: cytochrome oxidase small assembly protein [Burkholderiales bacterium]|nr:cytochrome oxidase small assembly protein [Burkholderiales bacterium]
MLSPDEEKRLAAKNRRTGLILAAIALAFFIGFFIRRYFQ